MPSNSTMDQQVPVKPSSTADLLHRIRLAPINPDCDDLDDGDVIETLPPIGRSEVSVRLAVHPWLVDNLTHYWPGGSNSPYVNAYASCARVITTALCLDTTNPEDLAYALSLPRAFVYAISHMLEMSGWDKLLGDLHNLPYLDSGSCCAAVTEFLHMLDAEFLHLLKVLGPSLHPPDGM